MFACKLKKYDLCKFIRGRTLVKFYCLLFALAHACILCYVTVAMQIKELI